MRVFATNSTRSNAGMFSPDGKWLVSCGEGCVFVWNPKEASAAVVYDRAQGHTISMSEIISLAINPACTIIAAGATDGSISILHLLHHQVLNCLQHHSDAVEGLAFSSKLNVLASAGLDSELVFWDMNNYTIRYQNRDEEVGEVTTLKWIRDPDTIVSASVSGQVTVRDGRSGLLLDQMGLKDVTCLDILPIPSQQLLFCAYDNGRVLSFAYN